MKYFFCEDRGQKQDWIPMPDFTTAKYAEALGMALPEDRFYIAREDEQGKREWLSCMAGHWAWHEVDEFLTYNVRGR